MAMSDNYLLVRSEDHDVWKELLGCLLYKPELILADHFVLLVESYCVANNTPSMISGLEGKR